mgnify:CR=1 FL=1
MIATKGELHEFLFWQFWILTNNIRAEMAANPNTTVLKHNDVVSTSIVAHNGGVTFKKTGRGYRLMALLGRPHIFPHRVLLLHINLAGYMNLNPQTRSEAYQV